MAMPPYPIYCSTEGCKAVAIYKIAARWTDGVVGELKTYGLCCEEHLPAAFVRAKQKTCRLTTGETLEEPGVYHLEHGRRDQALVRLDDVEKRLSV
jgi:hypothetical protein